MTEFSFEQEEKLINLELANAKALLIEKHKLGAISKKNYLQDDHARKMERKSMNLMTRQMTSGGGILGRSMAMLQQVGGMGMQNYQEKNNLRERVKGGSATTAEKSQFSMLSQSKTMGVFGKLDKIFEKSFGGNSKWNKAIDPVPHKIQKYKFLFSVLYQPRFLGSQKTIAFHNI